MKLLVLEQRRFNGLLDEMPTLSHKLLVAMAGRLRDADARASTRPSLSQSEAPPGRSPPRGRYSRSAPRLSDASTTWDRSRTLTSSSRDRARTASSSMMRQ